MKEKKNTRMVKTKLKIKSTVNEPGIAMGRISDEKPRIKKTLNRLLPMMLPTAMSVSFL